MTTELQTLSLSNRLYTYADYLTWNFTERLELIKGKIFKMSPAPNLEHQKVSFEIARQIGNYLLGKSCRAFSAPFDVRLPQVKGKKQAADKNVYTVVQPDICVVCDASKLDHRGCLGAPDLVIEILSRSTAAKDLTEKYEVYEQSGVREYWVVFPYEQIVQAYDLDETSGRYRLRKSYNRNEVIPVGIFSGFGITLSDVFEEKEEEHF
ncbi:Uma2 family endonuclease [Sphingobacteriales bacterium UPWRP_1]|nr:Uma2 family endonuclease [Sphingobacteriales bacterium UPWRP_1]